MITEALLSLAPGAQWSMTDEDYSTLEWNPANSIPKPSLEELVAEEARLAAIAASLKYKQLRAAEYPSIGDQLDALFHAGLFPADMAARLQAIKDKYPKG